VHGDGVVPSRLLHFLCGFPPLAGRVLRAVHQADEAYNPYENKFSMARCLSAEPLGIKNHIHFNSLETKCHLMQKYIKF